MRPRLKSQPLVGFVVMVFAGGFLIGVLAGHVRDTPSNTVATGAGTGSGELSPGENVDGAAGTDGALGAASGAADGGPGGAAGGAAGTRGAAARRGAAASGTGAAAGSGGGRGITDTSIKLGVACLNLGAFKAVPQYNIGDQVAQFQSVLAGWKRAGLVPVNGRNIELATRCFSPLSAEDRRATAVQLVQDQKVFSVAAMTTFADGAEIVAGEFRTPIISVSSMLANSYQRTAPFLFTVQGEMRTAGRNFVRWMQDQNLAGKKIGFYYLNDAYQPDVVRVMQAELAKLGNTNSVAVGTDNLLGGPTDAVAVQRFRSENVQVVALLTSPGGFIQSAKGQLYKPQYVQTDFAGPYVNDTATATYDADNFDGALAMTSTRTGEWRLGPEAKATRQCEDDYFKATGQQSSAQTKEAEWGALTHACEVMNLTLQALQKAGRDLTTTSFVRALETVAMEGAQYGNIGFSPTKHDGGSTFRTLTWTKGCHCWNVTAPAYRPFFVQ